MVARGVVAGSLQDFFPVRAITSQPPTLNPKLHVLRGAKWQAVCQADEAPCLLRL